MSICTLHKGDDDDDDHDNNNLLLLFTKIELSPNAVVILHAYKM
jgi:hypothetical protein